MARLTALEKMIVTEARIARMQNPFVLESCLRQAVCILFGGDRRVKAVQHGDGGIVRGEWQRADRTKHAIEGKIVDDRFVWRARLEDGTFGRWRDGPYDEVLRVCDGIVKMEEEE